MENINWTQIIDNVIKNGTLYGTIIAGLFGFYKSFMEYRNAQKWKKAEFLAKEAKEFFADKNVSRALIFLDYTQNDIPVYENEIEGKKSLRYNNELLMLAFGEERHITQFSQEELLIRKIFDDFLTKLGFFNHYVETKLITLDDLRPYLGYWMDVLANPNKSKRNKPLMNQIWQYIDKYSQDDVRKLAVSFGLNPVFDLPIPNPPTPSV